MSYPLDEIEHPVPETATVCSRGGFWLCGSSSQCCNHLTLFIRRPQIEVWRDWLWFCREWQVESHSIVCSL